jgi:copper chaperone CopZ
MKRLLLLTLILLSARAWSQDPEALVNIAIRTNAVCDMCRETIEKELIYEKGVRMVTLDLDSNVIRVQIDPKRTDVAKVRVAVTKLGYAADSLPPDAKARLELPACCQKEGCGLPHEKKD